MKKFLIFLVLVMVGGLLGLFIHNHFYSLNARINQKISKMSLAEKVGQMFYARVPEGAGVQAMKQYHFGGYLMFASDFKDQTPDSVRQTIANYQAAANLPAFIGVDEEGGTVNRVSLYPSFRAVPFQSPQELFAAGGWGLIKSDTKEKDQLLVSLGINTNFAPVADIPNEAGDFIFDRAFSTDPGQVSRYVQTVLDQMKGDKIAAVLKHFPGYGNNVDTHTGIAHDPRSLSSLEARDFLPFKAGIKEGSPFVLVAHNIMEQVDEKWPASLSRPIHQLLRDKLHYQGIIITDDLSMDAIRDYTGTDDAAVRAVLAGNDMLTVDDYVDQVPAVIAAVKNGKIRESRINQSVHRILEAKVQLGILKMD